MSTGQDVAQPKVLFIEDDPIVQFVHKHMLIDDCEVDIAPDAASALQMISKAYDLIFVDLGLPDLDGIELIQSMVAQKKLKEHTRMIILTASQQEEKSLRICFDAGVEAVLCKPVSMEQLRRLVFEKQAHTIN